jgi:hypothetical protein
MSDLTNVFTNIADAIRAKTETQITYKPTEMANAINNIETGGGGELVYNANGVPIQNWFNSPITIAEGVTSTAFMFSNCTNFSQPVTIPNSVTNAAFMFYNCTNFSQPVTIPNSVTNAVSMLNGCYNFNQPITIAEGVTSTVSMFSDCYNFNQPVAIPNSVTDATYMFYVCTNFNQPVTIAEGVTNAVSMFSSCYNFNQPVIIPNSVTNAVSMFSSCNNFNQPVTIPNSITNAAYMFSGCTNFSQPVTIAEDVTSVFRMFFNCSSFNQPVIIPNSVTNAMTMFNSCKSFGSNIYWYTNTQKTATRNMLANCNNSLAKHIFTNNTNAFNGTASSNSITGKAMTWTQDGANYYNTAYNIYIHNVANPYTILNNASYNFSSSSPIPDSPAIVFGSGVRDLNYAFYFWVETPLNSNTLILFEEGVENLKGCFLEQWMFNQPVTIPSSAKDCSEMFITCENLNSDIVFRNGVENIVYALSNCQNFASNIWIPESVTSMRQLLNNSPYADGTVHISHNIALGNTDNYIYNSLVNGYIGVTLDPSRILNDY